MLELEDRHPIINTLLHLTWHPKGICETERFWLEQHRKKVKGYEETPGHDEPHILRGSMNAWQKCVRNHTNCVDLWKLGHSSRHQGLGKIECVFGIMRWCLSTPGSSKYILPVAESIAVIPVSPYVYILIFRWYMPYCVIANLVTVTKMNMIDEMPCGCGTLWTTGVRIWHQVSCRACAKVAAVLSVSRGLVLRSQLLSISPADLRWSPSASTIWLF